MSDRDLLLRTSKEFVLAQGLAEAMNVLLKYQDTLLTWEAEFAFDLWVKEMSVRAGDDDPQTIHMKAKSHILKAARKLDIGALKSITDEGIGWVSRLVTAKTWRECKDILEAHKEFFFSDRADAAFLFMIEMVGHEDDAADEDDSKQKWFRLHHELVKSCQKKGIKKALDEVDPKDCGIFYMRSLHETSKK